MTDLSEALHGITCPIVTPFDDGDVDREALASLVEHLVDAGLDGLFPLGTTGEFASLGPDERRAVVETTVRATPDDVPVIAGASATSVGEVISHAERAEDAGADAVAVVPPFFHDANDPAGTRLFFDAVVDRSPLPVVLYNIPGNVGDSLDASVLSALAERDGVIALKDSSGDLTYFLRALYRTPDEFPVLQGFDTQLLASLRMGAAGGVNALSGVVPEAYVEMVSDPDGERAEELQEAIDPLFEIAAERGFAPTTKAALSYRGTIPSAEVRPPLVAVEEGTVAEAVDTAVSELV